MNFITDKQTLDDLNIRGKYRPDSVFSLFNMVVTRGGERLLNDMFQEPMTDHQKINERSSVFQYFTNNQSLKLPFSKASFHIMEEYLSSGEGQTSIATTALLVWWRKLLALTVKDEEYEAFQHQLITTIQQLNAFSRFLDECDTEADNIFLQHLNTVRNLFNHRLHWIENLKGKNHFSTWEIIKYDHQLRSVLVNEIKIILDAIYQLDVYMTVSNVARSKHFSYAHADPKEKNALTAINLRHPCLEKAVGNEISVSTDSNVIFLTGANMAGKSTFMKSFGIALYLAHMGFPVAADTMTFSVKDGLYTSINVPDNLSLGYSHFYAEVLRVKHVALAITKPLELVIIFDELFKGTNVKDAYDATLSVTEAFAGKRTCFFIISTHITEAGEELRKRCDNLQFVHFPSLLQGNSPVYTYKLEQGISNDKHGMMIIKKEGILELIEGHGFIL